MDNLPASPCIGVCQLNPTGEFCVGCGRTLDEIARWSEMDPDERARIAQRLARDHGDGAEGGDGES